MTDTLRPSTTLDSDDDEDEVGSTNQNFDRTASIKEEQMLSKDEITSTRDEITTTKEEKLSTKDDADAFDSSEETERSQTWRTFEKLTSKFFRVNFCLPYFNLLSF
jgi:hypothetical protein